MMQALVSYRLSRAELRLVRAYAAGHPLALIYGRAGYESEDDARAALALPRVAAALDAQIRHLLKTDLAPLALKAWRDILTTPGIDKRLQADVAKHVMDRAGYAPAKPEETDAGRKHVADMTVEELDREIERIRLEQSSRAKVIDVAPSEAPCVEPANQQVIDLIG